MEKVEAAITLADLQRLDAEERWVEVVDGEIVESEHDVTFLHLIIIQNLYDILKPFVTVHQLGRIFMDGARFILQGTPKRIRKARRPDLSFLRKGRISEDFDWSGDFVGAPDLAVEVASPGQTTAILLGKIADYLRAGSEEAWLIYPQHQQLHQFRRDAEIPIIYNYDEVVDTSALFPNLTLTVKDLFVTESE